MRSFRRFLILGLTAGAIARSTVPTLATPYASNVTKSANAVSFVLNEPTDTLKYSINGGALISLDGSTKGTKTFNLGSPTDTFSIIAEKTAATGYSIATGATVPSSDSGSLSVNTPAGGLNKISDDSQFYLYNSPRGIAVSLNPNAPNFGTTYISNSQAATVTAGATSRTLDKGFYAVGADGTDLFGYGNTPKNPVSQDGFTVAAVPPDPTSMNDPYRLTVGADGTVYSAGYADINSNVWALNPNLTSSTLLLAGYKGPTPIPAGQYHGSVVSVAQTGSLATNNLVLYTLDEDMTTAAVTGNPSDSTTDGFSVWKYTLTGAVPTNGYTTVPTKVADHLSPSAGNTFADMDRGADGKIYLSVNPSTANPSTTRLVVTDPAGVKIFDSLAASTALGAASDIISNLGQITVSPDQKWLAGMLNYSDVLVLPLVNGIPDLANRLVVDSGNVNSGRDIAFDAANNIHFVSSGISRYVVLSPGGHTITTLAWDGSNYSFNVQNVTSIPGDFDNNGVVNGADYVTWRKSPGTFGGSSGYDLWRTHFGLPSGGGAGLGENTAVPEPTTVMMLLIAGLFATFIRRRAVGS